jgi:hypothetical protein
MGDFLPPAALKVIAEDYQQGLLDRLNEQIKGEYLPWCLWILPRTHSYLFTGASYRYQP